MTHTQAYLDLLGLKLTDIKANPEPLNPISIRLEHATHACVQVHRAQSLGGFACRLQREEILAHALELVLPQLSALLFRITQRL